MRLLILALLLGITIYLLSEATRIVKAIRFSRNAPSQTGDFEVGKENKNNLSVLIMGDSIAAGMGINSFEQSVGGRLAIALGKKYHVCLTNNAKNGDKASDLALRKMNGRWDLVIIITGSNDLIRRVKPKKFELSLTELLKNLNSKSKHIVLVGPGDVASARALPFWARLRLRVKQNKLATLMSQVAKNTGAEYINPLEYPNSQSYFSGDGLHPNALGHKIWFYIIWSKLSVTYK